MERMPVNLDSSIAPEIMALAWEVGTRRTERRPMMRPLPLILHHLAPGRDDVGEVVGPDRRGFGQEGRVIRVHLGIRNRMDLHRGVGEDLLPFAGVVADQGCEGSVVMEDDHIGVIQEGGDFAESRIVQILFRGGDGGRKGG